MFSKVHVKKQHRPIASKTAVFNPLCQLVRILMTEIKLLKGMFWNIKSQINRTDSKTCLKYADGSTQTK